MLMADIKLEKYIPNPNAARIIMRSPMMASKVKRDAEKIRARAASMFGAKNYGVKVKTQKVAVKAYVYTGDRYAMRSNALHNTLKKAKGG